MGACKDGIQAFLGYASVEEIKGQLKQENPEAIILNGFDEALVGYINLWGGKSVAIYDSSTIIEILTEEFQYTPKQALDYFSNKIDQTYMGPNTPMFLVRPDNRKGGLQPLSGW